MRRLQHVISFASDIAKSRDFYRDAIGLTVVADTPFMVNFATDGTGLMLLALSPGQKQEVELCFESDNVASTVERLRGRGVQFIDELRQLAFGSVIHFRDPAGNLLSILQPGGAAKDGSGSRSVARAESAAGGARPRQTSLALAERGTGPRLATAIINCDDIVAARAYYTHLLGLHVSVDSAAWIQFDTGEIPLALHSLRDRTSVALAQPVSFGFSVPDMDEWVDAARERGVQFVSAPADEGFGLTAEILDPEGNVVVVREPLSEETLEERLAAAYEEDDEPVRTPVRSPARKIEHHTSWVAQRPDYKPAKKPNAQSAETAERAEERASRVASPRGTGASRSGEKPKRAADPERSKARPAIGRLKKAEARTLETAKRAAADASKSKPVKRASAKKTARGAKPKQTTRRSPRRG